MKQPALGIVATVLVMTLALAFISLFSFGTFVARVAFFLLCVIPMQIVIAVTWRGERPVFAASRRQPTRGILLTLVSLVVGGLATAAVIDAIGSGVTTPPPIVAHWTIVAVPVTFWAAIIFAGWPFTAWINSITRDRHQTTCSSRTDGRTHDPRRDSPAPNGRLQAHQWDARWVRPAG